MRGPLAGVRRGTSWKKRLSSQKIRHLSTRHRFVIVVEIAGHGAVVVGSIEGGVLFVAFGHDEGATVGEFAAAGFLGRSTGGGLAINLSLTPPGAVRVGQGDRTDQ